MGKVAQLTQPSHVFIMTLFLGLISFLAQGMH